MPKSYDRNSYSSSGSGSGRRSVRGERGSVTKRTASSRALSANASTPASQDAQAQLATTGSAANRRSREAGSHNPNNPYSRGGYHAGYTAERKRRKRTKVLMTCLVAFLVLVLAGGGVAFAYVMNLQSKMQSNVDQELLNALDTPKAGDPFYMLLMGVDGSEERANSKEYAGDNFRSDSIMLVRVDPSEKKVTAVSLMRDTQINMGKHGLQKLNAAHAFGGAAYAVKVVSEFAGVPISHYAEINFDAFRELVDTLGGIEVNVQYEINDPMAGGDGYVPAGQQTLDGEHALILCRSRHNYDDIGDGDQYRAANQRMVISAIAKKVLSSDVPTMIATIETLAQYVTTDMGVTDIISLANSMRGMDMNTDFYTGTNPTTSEYTNNVWWAISIDSQWKKMMQRIEQGLPPYEEDVVDAKTGIVMGAAGGSAVEEAATAAPKRVGKVSVRNGTEITGAAASAETVLKEMGYTVDSKNANRTDYKETVVVYEDDKDKELAQEIADKLGKGKVVKNNDEYLFQGDFLVLIGADWQ